MLELFRVLRGPPQISKALADEGPGTSERETKDSKTDGDERSMRS